MKPKKRNTAALLCAESYSHLIFQQQFGNAGEAGQQVLVEQNITVKRRTRVMNLYQFVLAIVLGLYVGFSRLNQLRFIARDPILTGILNVGGLPPQSTPWRFLASC